MQKKWKKTVYLLFVWEFRCVSLFGEVGPVVSHGALICLNQLKHRFFIAIHEIIARDSTIFMILQQMSIIQLSYVL